MDDKPSLSREKILTSTMEPIDVVAGPDLSLRFRGLTAADADYLATLPTTPGAARETIVQLLLHQIESPSLTEEDISSWDDDQLLTVFRVWAANENALSIPLDPNGGLDQAAEAVAQFAREWTRDLEGLASSPVLALANAARRVDLDPFTDPLGLNKLARQMREVEQMSRRVWAPSVLKGVVAGMTEIDLARRLDLPPVLTRSIVELHIPRPTTWVGASFGDQLSALKHAFGSVGGMDSIRALSMTRTTILAESALVGVDFATIGARLAIPRYAADVFTEAISGHFEAYGSLISGLSEAAPATDYRLTYDIPSIEVFNEAEMARALSRGPDEDETADERHQRSVEIAGELEAELPDLLRGIDPELVRMWDGARQARRSDNVDRSRHVVASLRTLVDDVLDHLAPPNAVKALGNADDLLDDGRVKREARFRYTGRNLEYKRLATAYDADMKALVAIYGVLNSVHDGKLDLSDRELGLVVMRIESALRFVILASQHA